MAYSKLHSSIVNSSLWTESDTVRILFITLLATCDREGIVYGTRFGLSRLANIAVEEAEDAWDSLLSTDPESSDLERAPENEGRRIEKIPGGFRLLNFAYYRGLRNDDDRREQNRAAQARFKAKVSHDKPASAEGKAKSASRARSEAEAEAEKEGDSLSSEVPSEEEFVAECKKLGVRPKFARDKYRWQVGKGWPANWRLSLLPRVKAWSDENGGKGGEFLPSESKNHPVAPPLTPDELAAAEAFKADAAKHGIKLHSQ